jgi:hypothetical protein
MKYLSFPLLCAQKNPTLLLDHLHNATYFSEIIFPY